MHGRIQEFLFIILFITLCTSIRNFNASDVKDECNNKGVYDKNLNECKCVNGFITFPKDSKLKCNYELKSEKVARFLSFLGGIFGADLFYLGYTYKGIFKCLFPIIVLLTLIYINQICVKNRTLNYSIILIPLFVIVLLWGSDLIGISFGWKKDANGLPLYIEE
jgi:hypothetical protein